MPDRPSVPPRLPAPPPVAEEPPNIPDSIPDDEPEPVTNGATAVGFMSDEHRAYIHAREDLEVARRALFRRHRELDPTVDEWERRTAWLTAVWPEGLGYRAGSAEGVSMKLTRLHETRGELSAELVVTRHGQHLLAQRFSLSSGSARNAVAKQLALHPFGGEGPSLGPVDWREILEQLCIGVLRLERSETDMTEEVGMRELAGEPPRAIKPYLPSDAIAMIWGPQGTSKSRIAAAVAVSLEAFVEVIPGWHPVEERRVMILDWEASAQEWNDRIARIAAGVGIEPPSIAYRRMRRPLAEQVEEIAAECDRLGTRYIIVDAYEKAAGSVGSNENYEAKASRMFSALDRIARGGLVLDHIAGEDLKRGPAQIVVKSIGSTLKGAWSRATYDLKADPNLSTGGRTELVMHNVKINDAERLPPYEFAVIEEPDRGPIRFVRSRLSSPELLASLPQRDQLRRHVVSGARPVKELAGLMNVTEGQIRSLVSRYPEFEHVVGVGVRLVANEDGSHA